MKKALTCLFLLLCFPLGGRAQANPFDPQSLQNLQSATLVWKDGGNIDIFPAADFTTTLDTPEELEKLIQVLGKAQETEPAGCSFNGISTLTLVTKHGGDITLGLDVDSCPIFKVGERYYHYQPDRDPAVDDSVGSRVLFDLFWPPDDLGQHALELPKEVQALLQGAHPDLQALAHDSWGSSWAVVLGGEQGAHTLCIVDKPLGQTAYRLAVDNPMALRQTGEIPRLHMDTDGALLYSYQAMDDIQCYLKIAAFRDSQGTWRMGHISFFSEGGTRKWSAYLKDGFLQSTLLYTDGNDNILSREEICPLPVPFLVGNDDLSSFQLRADVYNNDTALSQDIAAFILPKGARFITGRAGTQAVALEAVLDGERRIYIYQADKAGKPTMIRSQPLPEGASLDAYRSFHGVKIRGLDAQLGDGHHNFSQKRDGRWALSSVQGGGNFGIRLHCLLDYDNYRYQRIWFRENPWQDIQTVDLNALPFSLADARTQVDQSGCAVVNTPSPEDRLHLRTRADGKADSLGKYYNGSFLLVLEERGEWVKADIGGVQGWMMKQ